MTTGQKWFGLLLLQAGLLGAAYGGGRYPEWKKRQAEQESARKDLTKLAETSTRALMTTRARASLMEAALAVRYSNFGMAFDRVIRAQSVAQSLKLPLQNDFDELSALLITQKPEVLDKILSIADKIEPPLKLVPDEVLQKATKPTAMQVPGAGAPTAPAAAGSAPVPTAGAGPAAARPVAPVAAVAPAAAPAPPPAAASAPPRNAPPEATIEQSRAALLSAKELMIAGSEPAQIIPKLAHAQVVLEEGNHPEFSEQFTSAIKALRAHDEQKARSALDSILSSLRGL